MTRAESAKSEVRLLAELAAVHGGRRMVFGGKVGEGVRVGAENIITFGGEVASSRD